MRIAVLLVAALAAGVVACGDGAGIEYEVVVGFNASYTQEDLDETEALLRAYDDGLQYLIRESFPPSGVAIVETDEPDFCTTLEAELGAKTYVDSVTCEEAGAREPSGDPDEPVTNP